MKNLNEFPVFWLFGVCGAGKSALAQLLYKDLQEQYKVKIIDGDVFRNDTKNKDFSRDGRIRNVNSIREAIKSYQNDGNIVIVASILPYQEMRDSNKSQIFNYHEILVDTSLKNRISRNTKESMKLALQGKIQDYTGINGSFDTPVHSSLIIDNNGCIEDSYNRLLNYVKEVLKNHD